MNKKAIIRWFAYSAFSTFAFIIAFYLTFPMDALGQRISHEINKQSGGKLTTTFDDVSLYWFSGLEFEGVRIRKKNDEGKIDLIDIDAVRARFRLLPLLWFSPQLDARVELGEGVISAHIIPGDEQSEIYLEIEDLDFAKPAVLPKLIGFNIAGVLAGKLDLTLATPQDGKSKGGFSPLKSEGKASLTIRSGSFGAGQIAGFSVPQLALGQIDLALELRRGRLRISSFQQKEGQLGLDLSGSSTLRGKLDSSTLDFCAKFKVTDEAVLKKNPKLKTALDLAQVMLKKDGDDYLNLPLYGTLSRPKKRSGLCKGK